MGLFLLDQKDRARLDTASRHRRAGDVKENKTWNIPQGRLSWDIGEPESGIS